MATVQRRECGGLGAGTDCRWDEEVEPAVSRCIQVLAVYTRRQGLNERGGCWPTGGGAGGGADEAGCVLASESAARCND
jgi:hypothetical protein